MVKLEGEEARRLPGSVYASISGHFHDGLPYLQIVARSLDDPSPRHPIWGDSGRALARLLRGTANFGEVWCGGRLSKKADVPWACSFSRLCAGFYSLHFFIRRPLSLVLQGYRHLEPPGGGCVFPRGLRFHLAGAARNDPVRASRRISALDSRHTFRLASRSDRVSSSRHRSSAARQLALA